MKEKYSKNIDPVSKGYVTYYKHSSYESSQFTVKYDEHGNIELVRDMEKRISKDYTFNVNSENGNITELEYNEALFKALSFITKRNYSILISASFEKVTN